MTDAELQAIALQSLNLAKRDIEQKGTLSGLLAVSYPGEGLKRMTGVEEIIVEKLGEDWLSSSAKKNVAFEVLRIAVAHFPHPPDAVVIATAINLFKPTGKLERIGKQALEKLAKQDPDHHHSAVKQGLLTFEDALLAIAQTPRRVCFYQQIYQGWEWVGQPQVGFCDQDELDGSLKIFGIRNESGAS